MTFLAGLWPSPTVGVGVIGYGYWGPNLVRNCLQHEGFDDRCDELHGCSPGQVAEAASGRLVKFRVKPPPP